MLHIFIYPRDSPVYGLVLCTCGMLLQNIGPTIAVVYRTQAIDFRLRSIRSVHTSPRCKETGFFDRKFFTNERVKRMLVSLD